MLQQFGVTFTPSVLPRLTHYTGERPLFDLYGVEGGLFVASRRVPVTIEVLAPNMRPIQVTRDLANFWKESYPKIKQELQRKYPKHEWR